MFKICFKITAWLTLTGMAVAGCAWQTASLSTAPPDVHVSLGVAYLQQGNLEKARMVLNQALSKQPRSPAGWGAMAYLEEACGNLALAAQDYQQAIQLAPQQGDGHNNYGVFLCRHGQPRAGIQELLTAIQLPVMFIAQPPMKMPDCVH